MINSLIIILILSLMGSFIYVFAFLVLQFYDGYSAIWMRNIFLLGIFIFTMPAFIIVNMWLRYIFAFKTINIKQPDFSLYEYEPIVKSTKWIGLDNSPIIKIVFIIWLLGFVIVLCHKIIISIKFLCLAKQTSQNPSAEIVRKCECIGGLLRIKRKIVICKTSLPISPMLVGAVCPRVLINDDFYSEEELNLIITHELMHYKHHDILCKKVIVLIQAIHWFNPILYFYANSFYEISELACDQRVLQCVSNDSKKMYATLLIKMMENISKERSKFALCLFESDEEKIKRRLYRIMMYKKTNRKNLITILLTGLFLAYCPISAFAATNLVMKAQDSVARATVMNLSVFDADTEEHTVANIYNGAPFAMLKAVRGRNDIDITIPAGKEIHFNSLSLNTGSKVAVSVYGDSSSDYFWVGYMTSGGKRKYVDSSDGVVAHTFAIPSSGTYTFYISNHSDHDIHVTGIFSVTY